VTAETAEKLARQLDKLRAASFETGDDGWAYLADALEQQQREVAGRLEHADMMLHNVASGVALLLAELERFRPLLNMLRPANGTSAPDWISVGQTVRQARKAARRL
jgi:hypothetical protein